MRLNTYLILLFTIFVARHSSLAQVNYYEGAYRSIHNPHYWKNNPPDAGYWQQDVNYHIDATLDDDTEIIEGKMRVMYYNNSPFALDKIYFRLYQNAFTPFSDFHDITIANGVKPVYGKYESQGLGTVVESVSSPKFDLDTILDKTILQVAFKDQQKLQPGDSIELFLSFKTYFDSGSQRRRMKRFDHSGVKHFDGVLWYPRICVYDQKFTWHIDQHLSKEFYGNYGSYTVNLNLPDNYIVEATGKLQNKQEVLPDSLFEKIRIENYTDKSYRYTIPKSGRKTWKFEAVNVHDFAWTADPSYRIGVAYYNGIECIALAQEQNAHGWLPTAEFVKEVVRIYSEDFGMYAYPKMVAADARDGMEYPMITLNGGNWPGHQYVIAHEVGHNWFYGMLGNNETYRAFMDEGFTQFLTTWSLKKIKNQTKLPNQIDEQSLYNAYLMDALMGSETTLNTHSDDFENAVGHGGGYRQVYYKTATMLANLQYVLGDERFLNAMKHYVEKWKIKHPYPEDFRQAIIEYTQTDLNWFFDQWLETAKYIDYAIRPFGVSKQKNGDYKIRFERKGTMQMPLDLLVVTKSGKKLHYHIPNTSFIKDSQMNILPMWRGWGKLNRTYNATISPGEPIKYVQIDSSGRLADVYRIDNKSNGINHIYFDKGIAPPLDFKTYYIGLRPDIWWNPVDGLKIGAAFNQTYVKKQHNLDGAFWFNSGLLHNTDLKSDPNTFYTTLFSYTLDYNHQLGKGKSIEYHSRINDGISSDVFTYIQKKQSNSWFIQLKFLSSYMENNLFFHETPLVQQADYRHAFANKNHTVNMGYEHSFNKGRLNGKWNVKLRTPFLFSDVNYMGLQFESVQTLRIFGSKLKSRFYAATLATGNSQTQQVPLESQIFLGGANFEDMLDNKFTRTAGYIPQSMLWGATPGGNFQLGGGLNLRGYAGYLAPVVAAKSGDVSYLFAGNSGVSGSFEYSISDYFKIKSNKINRYMRTHIYAFSDVGVLSALQLQEFGKGIESPAPFRMDAGIGSTFTVNRWGKRTAIKPFTIRVDLPVFLNRPPADQDYLAFRWLIGIGKSF